MSSARQHVAKAEGNAFFSRQQNNPFWDWAVTANFYAPLHYVQAYFASRVPAINPATHRLRDSRIHADAKLTAIYVDYRQLEDDSRDARYDAAATFTQADVARSRKHLERVKSVILPWLP